MTLSSRTSMALRFCIAGGMVALVTSVLAGPMGQKRHAVPDEVRGLAGLTAVQVHVAPLSKEMVDAGLTTQYLEETIVKHLNRVGINVEDDLDLPKIVLVTLADRNDVNPAALACSVVIGIHQQVRLHRVDQELTVPTASISDVMLVQKHKAVDGVDQLVRRVVQGLFRYVAKADTALEATAR